MRKGKDFSSAFSMLLMTALSSNLRTVCVVFGGVVAPKLQCRRSAGRAAVPVTGFHFPSSRIIGILGVIDGIGVLGGNERYETTMRHLSKP